MKKIIVLATAMAFSATTFAASETGTTSQKLSTSELKAMDCATLAVEKSNAKRSLDTADKNLAAAQTQTPGKSISKWAGIAGGALSAFGKGDSKAGQLANTVAGPQDTSDASNVELQTQIKNDSHANIDNIAVYQKSKKCKI